MVQHPVLQTKNTCTGSIVKYCVRQNLVANVPQTPSGYQPTVTADGIWCLCMNTQNTQWTCYTGKNRITKTGEKIIMELGR